MRGNLLVLVSVRTCFYKLARVGKSGHRDCLIVKISVVKTVYPIVFLNTTTKTETINHASHYQGYLSPATQASTVQGQIRM